MARSAVVDVESLAADEESAKILAEVEAAGLSVTPLAEQGDKKGADIRVKLYHAFDGRTWEGPLYMTTGEGGAMSLTKYRFTEDQVKAVGADPKWVGKRVWYAEPQPVERINGDILCRFSVKQPKEKVDALKAQGFNVFCRKEVTFATEAQEDQHARMRHPKWYEFMEKKAEREAQQKTAQNQEVLTSALLELLKERGK